MIMLLPAGIKIFPHNNIIEASRLEGMSEIAIFFRMYVPMT